MNLDNMRVAIRPMSTAQAIDLGFMMARHWFLPLWKLWVAMALPVFLLIFMLIFVFADAKDDPLSSSTTYGVLLFWWLKPLYEKPLVTWLGSALFTEQNAPELQVRGLIRQAWKSYLQHAGKLLFRYRLSARRQLILPLLMLEKPDNTLFKSRLAVLGHGQSSGVSWFTIIMAHVEMSISFGFVTFIVMLIPEGLFNFESLMTYLEFAPLWIELSWAWIYFFTLSIVAPFFICGGFSVYLTKRCLLEGWDIELIFKQLNHRYQTTQTNPLTMLKNRN